MIAAAGTGGTVYPALAAAEALLKLQPKIKLHFVGSVGGFERPLVAESGLVFDAHDEVRAGPLHGVGLPQTIVSLVNLLIGIVQAFRLMLRNRPNVILLTGGWGGLPVSLAGWLLRVPIMIFLPDIEPGLTIKMLRPFARRVGITIPESARYFAPGKTVVTGYPVRRAVRESTREEGIACFKLDPARKTLLIFGGSRGSRAINNAVFEIAPGLLADNIQIIHVTGTLDWPEIEARYKDFDTHYHLFPYLHQEMGLALAAADLVVSRSGAGVLGEFPIFGLPSILIPLAYAWRYQQMNADYLAERGAAIHLDETNMANDLLPTIRAVFTEPGRLEKMRDSASALAQGDGAERIAQELIHLSEA